MHIHNELTPRQYLFMDPFDDVMTEKTIFNSELKLLWWHKIRQYEY